MYLRYDEEHFQDAEVCGIRCQFSDMRIDAGSLPDGKYKYEVAGDTHVGVFVGKNSNGDPLIIHCASSQNDVVLTGLQGFVSIGRPDCF